MDEDWRVGPRTNFTSRKFGGIRNEDRRGRCAMINRAERVERAERRAL